MTAIEIEKASAQIVIDKMAECKEKLAGIPKENVGEKKLLAMINGICDMCLNGGVLWKADDPMAMPRLQSNRIIPLAEKVNPQLTDKLKKCNSEELIMASAALYGELFMATVAKKYQAELEYADGKTDIEGKQEAKAKLMAVEQIMADWKAWRKANGVYDEY